jgi:hypothetical protein
MSGLLTAINLFSENTQGSKLKEITLASSRFSSIFSENIQFVLQHDNVKAQDLERISQEFSSKFLETFRLQLKEFNGDISVFEKFEKDADNILAQKGRPIQQKMHEFFSTF